jgi:hypothetical protein
MIILLTKNGGTKMKKIIIISLFFWANISLAQNVNLETGAFIDTSSYQMKSQRFSISNNVFNLKYDYNQTSSDVLSLIAPKILSDSLYSFGAGMIKVGDGNLEDSYVIDFFGGLKFDNWSISLETGRIINRGASPNDFLGGRFSYGNFTTEAYVLSDNFFREEMISRDDNFYAWIAYHPENFFISTGVSDKQFWLLGGTKNLNNFGNFLLANYNPQSGDFWFRNQSGFGKIDNNFFNQNLYLFAINYLVVPAFHFQHFSPVATKGSYSLKVDGRRISGVHYYEIAMGKEIGLNAFRMAVGINSEYKESIRLAPTIEFYKEFKYEHTRSILELRYDFLFKSLSAYLIFEY